jgi:two-component system sensor histidine kinase KdpD
LVVADSRDWLALAVFLVVGLVVGLQTARLRDREARAVSRERESAVLATLSSSLVSEDSREAMGQTLVTEVSRLLHGSRTMLFVAQDADSCVLLAVSPGDRAPLPAEMAAASQVAAKNAPLTVLEDVSGPDGSPVVREWRLGEWSTAAAAVFLPVQTEGRVQGVLAVEPAGESKPLGAPGLRLMQAAANLAAAFLERQRLMEAAARAEALREADKLKSSLLSSVSHELKTPLAALTATVSNLLEGDTEWDEETVKEELRAIVADVTRLNHSISSLLDLSRLEAHAWEPHRDWNDLKEIILTGLDALPVHLRGRVRLRLPADLPLVYVDFVQVSRAFQNLIENGLLYSGDAPVVVGAREKEDGVIAWIEDQGLGVNDSEKDLIFEKFYRGAETCVSRPFGTGLGLAVAREIVLENGGSIGVEDVKPHGARFLVVLPTNGRLEGLRE